MAKKQDQTPFLSLIIPCYKQEKTIVENVQDVLENLDNTRYSYEVIIVVDGIVDDSYKNLEKAKLHNTKVFAYQDNRGKSFAIRFGMKQAKGENVMFLDAGREIDTDGISMLLEHLQWYDADIIVGSKRHLASQVQYTWQRKVLSFGYYYFVNMLFGVKVTDTQAGIKVFKRSVIEKILPRLVEKRFAGDLEMLAVAKKMGFGRIYEAPIKLDYQLGPISSAATWKQIFGILIDTLAIYYRLKFIHYYDEVRTKTQRPSEVLSKEFPNKEI